MSSYGEEDRERMIDIKCILSRLINMDVGQAQYTRVAN